MDFCFVLSYEKISCKNTILVYVIQISLKNNMKINMKKNKKIYI